jgi:serine protease Do
VLAVGNPFGLGGSVNAGIISARGRDIQSGPYDDYLQIDAPINRGNSGGPLFDARGRVIGVNTAIYSPSGGNIGIGFAIPAETVADVVDELRTKGRVERGWLGVQIQPVTEAVAGSLGLDRPSGVLGGRCACRTARRGRRRAQRRRHPRPLASRWRSIAT